VPAIVSVLLHDLVVGDRSATICGRERNPTCIESAIRARFVQDSFHNLNTGLPTGLSHCRGQGGAPCRRDGQPSAVPGKYARCRRADPWTALPAGLRGTGQCRLPGRGPSSPDHDASASTSAAAKLGAAAAIAPVTRRRAARVGRLRQRLPDLWEACIFRVARCTRGSERGWNPLAGAHHAARSVICDPCELYCACRSVTESIPS
jgi:hypothetical protein